MIIEAIEFGDCGLNEIRVFRHDCGETSPETMEKTTEKETIRGEAQDQETVMAVATAITEF
jgi:hypothetical protein